MRLTKMIRAKIQHKVLESVIRARVGEFMLEEHGLALRLTISRYGADVFDRCREFPEGWLNAHKNIILDYTVREQLPQPLTSARFYHDGNYLDYQVTALSLAEYVILPNSFAKAWTAEDMDGRVPTELHDYALRRAEWVDELDHLNKQLKATLDSFTTVERLAQDWPEGYAFFPHDTLGKIAGLPAPRIADLNQRIAIMRKDAA